MTTWNENPVEFGDNVTYICEEGFYFEMDRDKTEFGITCLDSGLWDEPQLWPRCVETVHCGPPPQKHESGMVLVIFEIIFLMMIF